MKTLHAITALALAASALSAQAFDAEGEAHAMIKRDFKAKGIATLDRVNQDGVQALCNKTDNKPPKEMRLLLQKDQADAVRYPADGKFMGDWKRGEKIAQSGVGMTWRDPADKPAGGNCYNCHQITKEELSYGTIGPSLYRLGKERGSGPDRQKAVYAQIYNAKAFNLCANMPRFGHVGALNEQQIKDLVALLLDPQSPANK